MRFPRTAAALALATAVALGTAGCGFLTPIATLNQYNPSDGVNGKVGTVDVLNLVGILSEDGTALNVLVVFVNNGSDDVGLTVQITDGGQKITREVELPARNAVTYGIEESEDLLFLDLDVRAGQLLPVYFQYGNEPGKTLQMPILTGVQAEYEGLIRESPAPTPTPTPTPEPTEAPAEEPTEGEG